jgi:hypothetical protein
MLGQPRRRARLIPLAVGGAIGLALGVGAQFLPNNVGDLLLPWLLGFQVALFLGILPHELGHLAAGKLAGFDFHNILAGPWMLSKESLSKESGGYKLRFFPRRILATAGHTVMIPRTTENLRHNFALFAAGGPVATALLFLPVGFLPWGLPMACLLPANLVLAFFSWVPMTVGGSHTDAKVLRTLAGKGPSSERFAAILYVMAIDNRGVEPRQWPREILDKLAGDAHEDPHCQEFVGEAATLLHVHAFDLGDAAAMAGALEKVLGWSHRMRPDLRRVYFAEAAFFQGVFRKNGVLARAWLEDARKVKGGVALQDWDAAPLAAIALAEENWEEARAQISQAIAFLDRQPGARGSVSVARRRLEALAASLPSGVSMAAPNLDR